MTRPDLISLYRERASARLESAGFLLRSNPSRPFSTAPDGDLARSNIGMTIWSAAIDIGSILLLRENGTEPSGRSPEISRFITKVLHQQHLELNLRLAWSVLTQLHNIQHRGRHAQSRFATATTAARRSFTVLNHLLHGVHQIDPGAYSWLGRVRNRYVDWFRDEPPTQWTRIQAEELNRPFPGIGSVPLRWAAQWQDDAEVVRLLIRAGARRTPRSFTGQRPHDIAVGSSSYFAELLAS